MMKKKNLYVLMAAAFVLASCAKSEDPASVNNDEVELSVKSSVIDVTVTRATYTGTTPTTTTPLTALVLTSTAPLNYSALHCEGTMTFTSATNVAYNKPVASGDFLFPGSATCYMSALYPATGWDLTTTPGTASRPLTGSEDVMFAPQAQTSKALVTGATPAYPTLAFAHKLTYLHLLFSGDTDATSSTALTTVTNIQLIQAGGVAVPTTVVVDLGNPQTVSCTGTGTALDCYYFDGTTDKNFATAYSTGYLVTTSPIEKAYTLAPPAKMSAVGSYEYVFKVDYTVAGATKSMSVNVDLTTASGTPPVLNASTAGYAFNIKFNFLGGQIVAVASVTDWLPGGDVNINL